MTPRPLNFGGARRLVVKIGSAVLRQGADFDRVTFSSLVRDVVTLRRAGLEVVVVCSGAVALGLARLGRPTRPRLRAALQATASIGQGRLIRMWSDELDAYGQVAAQVLLTHEDLKDRKRFLSARQTLRALLEMDAVPIINENDAVAFEEIKLGDNDLLSSQVVSLVGAEALVILSDVEGLFDRPPQVEGARRLAWVARIDEALLASAGASTSGLGSGGMRTKVEAVAQVNDLGVAAIIAPGKHPGVLQALAAGAPLGTWFDAKASEMGSRKHWIAYAQPPRGRLHIDAGARQAVLTSGRSLLAVGVTRVEGAFELGDPVAIVDPEGVEVARGLVSEGAEEVRAWLARRATEPPKALVLVHRDDMALLPDR
ncbi:glutamate 5-kinase [Myxococcota bacterium]|nr:glutamate 5-kinase [Myxococcota bacterium]MBU1430524.1 glutamate 5-kinase [Myxococcota bacterium]MBU1900222.1 glutamate 5-kinase [Myxococcota bacterium]